MTKTIKKRNLILEQTIELSYQEGFENISTKKISQLIDISEGSIFYHYETKGVLLTECLYYIDKQIDEILHSVKIEKLHPTHSIKNLWYTYFQFLLDHPAYTKFYRDFRFSSYYDDKTIKGQDKSFHFFSKFANGLLKRIGIDTDVFWVFVIETTLNFAVRMNDHHIEKTQENIDKIYSIILTGINGSLPKE